MAIFDIVINGCSYLAPDLSIADNVSICISGTKIARIETDPHAAQNLEAEVFLEGRGKLAIPGLVDAHTHAAQQLLRGSVVDELPMVWARILVPFESSLTPEDVRAGALLFCLESLKAGITSFCDAGGPHMEAVAEAVLTTGMRAGICYSTMDQGDFVPASMKRPAAELIARTEDLYRAYHNKGNGRLRVWFGLRQAITSTPELLEATATRSRELGTGVHAHLAEHLDEVSHCLSNYQKRPAEWFDHFGLLGPGFIGAHSVRLSDREVCLMADRRANAVHCPRSNLGSHGFPKTPLMLALGVNIGLGTDGGAGGRLDLFEQMRLLKSATQARYGIEINDPLALPTAETLRMATAGGARAMMLEHEIGAIEIGKHADIVLLNLDVPHLSPTADLRKTIVMSAGPADVCDVMVHGQLLLRGRQFIALDEEQIRHQAAETLMRVGHRAGLRLPAPYLG